MELHIFIIGAGRMAEAIIAGLRRQTQVSIFITVQNKEDTKRLKVLQENYQVDVATDFGKHIVDADVVLLATPPQTHEQLFKKITPFLHEQLVITVAAGIDPTFMEKRLPNGTPVAWIMPNTAAQIQKSMSTYVCGSFVTEKHRTILDIILSSIGDYTELTESQVHDLTAITGSAPAFLYYFCEALEEAAISYGLNAAKARTLVKTMVTGSAAMLDLNYSPKELREQVTTPGGSTAAGLNILENGHFQELLKEAVKATNTHASNSKKNS